ncbi:type 4a pilus biogenesis protein PilN [Oceaniserpentilla sp. 4NH20-0058]|uniref:PilN domain-containing protein n=1 Tax=Oceaniserpentilla sp. 4NH20-0058 TaxID=3127660 RepID=UPI00310370DD
MATINLRPWREELRQERQKEYTGVLILVFMAAGVIWWFGSSAIESSIKDQEYRNQYIQKQTSALESKIKEIQELRNKKRELLDRMRLIQDLQGNRPVIVRVFDEMARVMPKELFFNSISSKGNQFTLKGKASSNDQISQLMRNFDASPWFTNPILLGVNGSDGGFNSFDMLVTQSTPALEEVK